MWSELRHALRFLARAPGFTAVALLTLALGIGANTALFTLVNAVLLRELPVGHPGQLALLTDPTAMGMFYGTSGGRRGLLAYPEYRRLRQDDQAFIGLLAAGSMSNQDSLVWGQGALERARIKLVSNNYFSVLEVPGFHGRYFDPAESPAPGSEPLAVMSYGYWSRRFARSPAVLGRTFRMLGHVYTVIGITPPGFHGENVGDAPDLYLPLAMANAASPGMDLLHNPPGVSRAMWLQVMGRLKLGVTLAQAQAASNGIFHRLVAAQAVAAADAQSRRSILSQKLDLSPGGRGTSGLRGDFGDPLVALFALVGLLLVLAIVNLASLLLARASARHKEMGVRLALGAGPGRVLRQLLTESLLLSIAGGLAGAGLAVWGDRLLLRMVGGMGPGIPVQLNLAPDGRVLGFIAFLCIASGVLFGLAPAWRLARLDINAALQTGGRGGAARSRHVLDQWIRGGLPLGKILVIGQVALSLVLLAGAGLFVRSLRQLSAAPLGFQPRHLLEVRLDVASGGYQGPAAAIFLRQLQSKIRALPGVEAAALSDNGLFENSECGLPVSTPGYTAPNGKPGFGVRCNSVTAGYFRVAGIPILLGRGLQASDETGAQNIVISQTLARRIFASRDPLGHQLHDLYPDDHGAVYTIVGVAADAKQNSLGEKPTPRIYLPLFNNFSHNAGLSGAVLMIRGEGSAAALGGSIRAALRAADRSLPPVNIQTADQLVGQSLAPQTMLARLSGFFAALALLLAAIGLYGITAYGLARRVPEIGVRMALGARRATVVAMILGETAVLIGLGLLLGVPASLAGAKVIASTMQLYGLRFYDPAAMISAIVILALAAMLAGLLPALRASRLDPLEALREE